MLLYLFIAIILTEYISKNSLSRIRLLKPLYIGGNMGILMELILLFYALTGLWIFSLFLSSLLLLALSLAAKIKLDYRQVGFTPMDFRILKEAKSMAGALNKRTIGRLTSKSILLMMLLTLISWNLKAPVLAPIEKALVFSTWLFMLLLFFVIGPYFQSKASVYKIGNLLYFLLYLQNPVALIPTKTIDPTLFDAIPRKLTDLGQYPDIIVIQSESFCDPTLLGMEQFSQDPLPYFHLLQKESQAFTLATRAYGGGTVHTEFEILTGVSSVFFPRDTTVFSDYIKEPHISLASILKQQGYRATFLHPYENWFYNRNKVYKELGFDRFLSKSAFPKEDHPYLKDKSLYRMMLSQLQEKPSLLFGVSMQNHTPYREDRFPHRITYRGDLSNRETAIHFNHYLQGLKESDDALKELISTLRTRERETILLFYGDHLPVVNQDGAFYDNLSWSSYPFGSNPWHFALSKTPGLIWSNKRNLFNPEFKTDGIFILGQLLEFSGLSYPKYLDTLNSINRSDHLEGMFREYLVKDGIFFTENMPQYKRTYEVLKDLNAAVFYSKENPWLFVNPDYTLE